MSRQVDATDVPGPPYSLDQYQTDSTATAVYPGQNSFFGLVYVSLKLTGEAGEVSENVGKAIRDDEILDIDDNYLDKPVAFAQPMAMQRKDKLIKELGDVLWYVAAVATELGVTLSEVAYANRAKLADRKERGTLQGAGDDR